MGTRYKVGDKVMMYDEFMHRNYGTGIIVEIATYPGYTPAYMVKSDRTKKVWDYPARQLRLVKRGSRR